MTHETETCVKRTKQSSLSPFVTFRSLILGAGFLFLFGPLAIGDTRSSDIFKTFSKQNLSLWAKGVAVTDRQSFLVVGSIFDDAGPSSWGWAVKMDEGGNVLWEKELGEKARDSEFYRAISMRNGTTILVGSVNSSSSGPMEKSSAWLIAIDDSGRVLWEKPFQLERVTRAFDARAADDGSILVIGIINANDKNASFIAKLNQSGELIWRKLIESKWESNASKLYGLGDGTFLVSGSARDKTNPFPQAWIAVINDNGELKMENRFDVGSNSFSEVGALQEVGNGAILLGINIMEGAKKSIRLVKLMKDGSRQWERNVEKHELCKIVSLGLKREGQFVALGQMCRGHAKSFWSAQLSQEGQILSWKEYSNRPNMNLSQGIFLPEGFVAVGESETRANLSQAWLLRSAF